MDTSDIHIYGMILNSITDTNTPAPIVFKVVPAGSHIGSSKGSVFWVNAE